MTKPVFPGIAEFKAEPPIPGHARVWHLNGCVEDGNPDDVESWAWLAEITPYWGNEGGDLARFLARAANSHNALLAALQHFIRNDGHTRHCGYFPGSKYPCTRECADARAALARGEPS